METVDNQATLNPSVQLIKARCPSCFKLYAIDVAEIVEPKPQFQCIKCQCRFWFPFPESVGMNEVLGFPVEWLQRGSVQAEEATSAAPSGAAAATAPSLTVSAPAARVFHCPRCEAEYRAGDPECPKCGVVFAKLEMLEDGSAPAASPTLRRLWHRVVDSYGDINWHRKFVQAAQREGNLTYASHQYSRLLKAHSGDETALKMQKEIAVLMETVQGLPPRSAWWRPSNLMPRVSTLFLILGGALIGLGFMIEAQRNLIGLGAAIIFFTLAVDWLFKRAV